MLGNNVPIRLQKKTRHRLAANLLVRRSLQSRGALFAEDIGCWETQDGLERNVWSPHTHPREGWRSHRGGAR